MILLVRNTAHGLVPLYDEDYEEKKKLKIGQDYQADVKLPRNLRFHKKFFSLIACAWDLLTPRGRQFFRNKECFRKSLLVTSGHCEPVYNHSLRAWVDIPKSLKFDCMREEEFADVYRDVRTVLEQQILHLDTKKFEKYLMNY